MKRIHIPGFLVALLVMQSCTDFKDIPYIFQVSTRELVFSVEGETLSLRVSSGARWDISSIPGWISLKAISQSGRSSYEWDVSFAVSANDGYNREGRIIIKTETENADVFVLQEGKKGKSGYIDLGLSVKWAVCNLGASKPEERGDYYAWGETEPYYGYVLSDSFKWKDGKETGYSWSSYKWCMGAVKTITKYCARSSDGYNGFMDGKTVLDPEDDAAHVNLGEKWRIPTEEEWSELMSNCTWNWITLNGVNGHVVTGKNGNSIFLPAAGWIEETSIQSYNRRGRYWCSSMDVVYYDANGTWAMSSNEADVVGVYYLRYTGFSIRPVCAE